MVVTVYQNLSILNKKTVTWKPLMLTKLFMIEYNDIQNYFRYKLMAQFQLQFPSVDILIDINTGLLHQSNRFVTWTSRIGISRQH